MAEATIAVTAGSGTLLHSYTRTIGGNTVHNEAMVLAEPHLASYLVSVGPSTATANSHLLQIMAGATLKVRIRRIEVHQELLATTATLMDLRLYRLTTAGTGGTAGTLAALDPSESAAGATAMTLPTTKGTEGALLGLQNPYMLQTIGASAPLIQPIALWDFDRLRSKPLVIAAGTSNGIAIKNVDAVAGGGVFINVWLDEATF